MPDTPVATNLNKTFDVKVNLFPKLTLNPILPVNKLSDTINLIFSKATHLGIRADASLG